MAILEESHITLLDKKIIKNLVTLMVIKKKLMTSLTFQSNQGFVYIYSSHLMSND